MFRRKFKWDIPVADNETAQTHVETVESYWDPKAFGTVTAVTHAGRIQAIKRAGRPFMNSGNPKLVGDTLTTMAT